MLMLGILLASAPAEARDLSRLERPGLYRAGVALAATGFVVGGTGNLLLVGGSLSQAPDASLAVFTGVAGMAIGYPLAGAGASMSAAAIRDVRYDHTIWPGVVGSATGSWPFTLVQLSKNAKALDQMTRSSGDDSWREEERRFLDELDELDEIDDPLPPGPEQGAFLDQGMPRLGELRLG
ncbi:MAG: hypothetical protein GY913_02155 [Proteobacteria bacterium]|nr:hypothetical protein [Pseudomonadota bacterium]MCP4915702.1 hypothetical protein [Pseudomonadota bacterium]